MAEEYEHLIVTLAKSFAVLAKYTENEHDDSFTARTATGSRLDKDADFVSDEGDHLNRHYETKVTPTEMLAARVAGLQASQTLLSQLNIDVSSGTNNEEGDVGGTLSSKASAEQDFTTLGNEGQLRCSFATGSAAKPANHPDQTSQALPTPPPTKQNTNSAIIDPISAEFHPEAISSPPPSASGAASKCPIRFLDRHSATEIAQYFENHKHEIPRSHEVCVKRYQKNSQSIRQLDAKYGDLVSMIQGLGQKHQPMLPEDEEEARSLEAEVTNTRVEQWAENLSANNGDDPLADNRLSEREGHFERPLKEVRVGESPSRPWGISIPLTDIPIAEISSEREPFKREVQPDVAAETISKPSTSRLSQASQDEQRSRQSNRGVHETHPRIAGHSVHPKGPNMIFTGPVFIGYHPDQAKQVMSDFQSAEPRAL